MGNSKSKSDIKIPHHFIYVYINDKINIPAISKQLLIFINTNIDILKNNCFFKIFYISYDDIKNNNQNLVQLLKKNNINDLPALKIKYKKKAGDIYVGTNSIIEYYFSQFGNQLNISPMPSNNMPSNNMPSNNMSSNSMPRNNMPSNNMPRNNMPINNMPINNMPINNMPSNNMPSNNMPSNNMPRNHIEGYDDRDYDDKENIMNYMASNLYDVDNDQEEIPINDSKNIISKFDEMVKFRSTLKGGSPLKGGSSHSDRAPHSDKLSNSSNNTPRRPKSSIDKKLLEDSPFKEGDLDDLDDNLSISDDSNITESLKKINYSAPARNNAFTLGDDDADDEKDLLMEKSFWQNH